MQVVTLPELERLRADRRSLEVDVATAIANYLLDNEGALRIGRMIGSMVDQVLQLGAHAPPGCDVDGSLICKQTSFAMWSICGQQPGLQGVQAVGRYVAAGPGGRTEWLTVCSDVIRLFGELSESALAQSIWGAALGKMLDKAQLRPEPVYGKPKVNDQGWGHRDRNDKENPAVMQQPFVDIPRQAVPWRGVEKFSFGDRSVIQTIDWTFGLHIEGGDISGTTSDSIAALRWAGQDRNNALSQLIAIATMVPQGHHALVECAWPLTRHGYMDYAIGFYGTLVLPGMGHDALRATLERFDADPRNLHLLVCAGTGLSQMNFLFDKPDEIKAYRQVAGIRRAYGFCVGGRTDVKGLQNMLQAGGATTELASRLSRWG